MHTNAYAHELMAEACKAAADPTRVRILATILGAGELCVCHVEQALGLTQSRASRHLAALKRAGLLVDRRDGAWVHYRAADRPGPFAAALLDMARGFAEDPGVRADVARAAALRAAACCDGGGP